MFNVKGNMFTKNGKKGLDLSSQYGRSMIEMIGVLSILGLLSIAGFWGYSRAVHNLKRNGIEDEISDLVSNIRDIYFSTANYEDLTIPTLLKQGNLPRQYISGDGLVHPYGGEVIIGTAHYKKYANGAFILIFNNLDRQTCQELFALDWGTEDNTGFLGITVKSDGALTLEETNLINDPVVTKDSTYNYHNVKVTFSRISAICACYEGATCSIAWKFK